MIRYIEWFWRIVLYSVNKLLLGALRKIYAAFFKSEIKTSLSFVQGQI